MPSAKYLRTKKSQRLGNAVLVKVESDAKVLGYLSDFALSDMCLFGRTHCPGMDDAAGIASELLYYTSLSFSSTLCIEDFLLA
jgi:hypothetical protein